VFDGDYFWKFTHNAYDFDVLFNTPITFPIAWHNSKLDGLTGRVSTVNIRGFQAYTTFGHTRARYFPPEVGGLIFQGTASVPGVFRIDHDQAFQQTTNLRYQHKHDGLCSAAHVSGIDRLRVLDLREGGDPLRVRISRHIGKTLQAGRGLEAACRGRAPLWSQRERRP
jgi:hypothetical protein